VRVATAAYMPMVLLIHPDVQTALNATKIGKTTFITKDVAGNPFSTKKRLGLWFKMAGAVGRVGGQPVLCGRAGNPLPMICSTGRSWLAR
jgi:hypothetical protein